MSMSKESRSLEDLMGSAEEDRDNFIRCSYGHSLWSANDKSNERSCITLESQVPMSNLQCIDLSGLSSGIGVLSPESLDEAQDEWKGPAEPMGKSASPYTSDGNVDVVIEETPEISFGSCSPFSFKHLRDILKFYNLPSRVDVIPSLPQASTCASEPVISDSSEPDSENIISGLEVQASFSESSCRSHRRHKVPIHVNEPIVSCDATIGDNGRARRADLSGHRGEYRIDGRTLLDSTRASKGLICAVEDTDDANKTDSDATWYDDNNLTIPNERDFPSYLDLGRLYLPDGSFIVTPVSKIVKNTVFKGCQQNLYLNSNCIFYNVQSIVPHCVQLQVNDDDFTIDDLQRQFRDTKSPDILEINENRLVNNCLLEHSRGHMQSCIDDQSNEKDLDDFQSQGFLLSLPLSPENTECVLLPSDVLLSNYCSEYDKAYTKKDLKPISYRNYYINRVNNTLKNDFDTIITPKQSLRSFFNTSDNIFEESESNLHDTVDNILHTLKNDLDDNFTMTDNLVL